MILSRSCGVLAALVLAFAEEAIFAESSAPVIAADPQSQIVNQGTTVTLTVQATGSDPLAYQWFFNSTNVLAKGTNASLSLPNVQATNQGSYFVVLTNSFGSATSQVATLTIRLRPVITLQPHSQTVAMGGDASFSISASGALPISYAWWRNLQVRATNIILNDNTCVFTIFNVQTNDTGKWNAFVTNIAGAAPFSSNAQLTVFFPIVTNGFVLLSESCAPGNGTVDPGEIVTLDLALLNTNAPATSNFVATPENGGVTWLSGPQSYEGVTLGGPSASRPFTFTANGACGSTTTATLRLWDGTNDLGRVKFAIRLGSLLRPCCLDSAAADLAVKLIATPNPAIVGSNLTYTVTVTNRGPATATGVILSNTLPGSVALMSALPSQGSCTNVDGIVVCDIGTVARSEKATVTLTAIATLAGTTLTCTAQVIGNEPDYDNANNSGTAIITMNPPAISIGETSVVEGDSGSTNAVFVVSLSGPSAQTVTVNYATADGTARTNNGDYVPVSGTLIFSPGATNHTIVVPVIGDLNYESNETFFVNLSGTVNASVRDSQGLCTISNDDPQPAISISDGAAVSDAAASFVVTLSASSVQTVSVHYATADGSAMTNHGDYVAASGTVAFPPGTTQQTISVTVNGGQPGAAFAVNLSQAINGFIVDGEGIGTILPKGISNTPREDFWVTDGEVYTVLEVNGIVYIGGSFNYVFPKGRVGMAVNLESGEPDLAVPDITGEVTTAAPDGFGGWFIGASWPGFLSVGGLARTNLARIRADNTVDPEWGPQVRWQQGAGHVENLDVIGNIVYVAGYFDSINGVPRSGIAALDATTGEVLPWDPAAGRWGWGTQGDFWIFRDTVYVFLIEASTRSFMALDEAYDGLTGNVKPSSFNFSSNFTPRVATCDLIYGITTTFHDPDTNYWPATHVITAKDARSGHVVWQADLDSSAYQCGTAGDHGSVSSMALGPDALFVAGRFEAVRGGSAGWQPRTNLVALDPKTGTVLLWNPNAVSYLSQRDPVYGSGGVTALVFANDTVYVGGDFASIGGREHLGFAALDPVTGLVKDSNLPITVKTSAISISGRRLFAGGTVAIGGKARRNVAALDATTGMATDWNPNIDGQVNAFAVSGDTIYAGGERIECNESRFFLAAIDRPTGHVIPWQPMPLPSVGISSLAADSRAVYISFIGAPGIAYIGAYSASTGQELWSTANVLSNSCCGYGGYPTMALGSNTLFVAGLFDSVRPQLGTNQARRSLAALDPVTGFPKPWNPNPFSDLRFFSLPRITGLAVSGDRVFISGSFTKIGGASRPGLAALDANTAEALDWNPFWPSHDIFPQLLSVVGTTVFSAGTFGYADPEERIEYFADTWAWNTTTAEETGWRAFLHNFGEFMDDEIVWSVAATSRAVYVGGAFTLVNGRYQPNIAVFPLEGAPVVTTQPANQLLPEGQILTLTATITGNAPLFYQWRLKGTNLPSATNTTFSIANPHAADSGSYTLVVTNFLGYIRSAEAVVTVFVPPQITTQPASQTVSPSANVTMSVTVSGAPSPRYQWRLNGVNIPGATLPALSITNAQPTNGGSYTVVAANVGGVANSDIASLLVTSPLLPFADNLEGRMSLNSYSGVGSGSNVGATKESGETNHVGKLGGTSVWLSWIAPANGIATFTTRGSSFDTLLAIYTGTSVADLSPIAADDDRGGFLTSEASFNAVAGIEYLVVVDGFASAMGNIVLSWNLDISTVPFPRIIKQPLSQSAFAGQTTVFDVAVNTATPETYQWFFGCQPIPDATNATLTVSNVQRGSVGAYHVVVMNASSRSAQSFDVFLEIGPVPKAISQDKLEDLFVSSSGSGASLFGGYKKSSFSALPSSSFVSVSAGTIDSQIFNNVGAATQQGEPNHCGFIGGSSKWFGLKALDDATFMIDTIGSDFDTVLAVYRRTNLIYLAANEVACDNNSAPDRIRSLVRFPAVRNQEYVIAVDGVNAAQGLINLNWRLGVAPLITSSPSSQTIRIGSSVTLAASVDSLTRDLTYQWRWNGRNIVGATNGTLTLPSLASGQSGNYSVIVSNFVGAVENIIAILSVEIPYLRLEPVSNGRTVRLWFPASGAPSAVVDSSADLLSWDSLYTITATNNVPYVEILATNTSWFFRARPLP